jgi:hypothetical protein
MRPVLGIACAAALALPALAFPQKQDDDEPLRCVSMASIRRSTIVNDDSILFYQSGGRIFLNTLDRTCPGLARNGKFMFQVQSGARYVRVCATDTITVLERTGRGFSCGLGEFVPVTQQVAQQLLEPLAPGESQRAITVEPAEVPKAEAPRP